MTLSDEARCFAELVGLPESERAAYLSTLDLDPDARNQLLSLLALDNDSEEDFLSAIQEEARLWSDQDTLEPGTMVGRFLIEKRLGQGGTGEVFLVLFEEEGSTRQAALKILHSHLHRSGQITLWDRERRLVSRLSHPYIASLIESGTLYSGQPYLLMEYVEGQRIDHYCETLPIQQRIQIMAKVCDAVGAAHRQLIVHRDLKPGNILITVDGLPKLLDFGIGQALDRDQQTFEAATLAYASPEQLTGAEPTTASDLFSLGRILEKLIPRSDPSLLSIVRKATHTNPDLRYDSAAALRDDLNRWLEIRPVTSHPDTWRYRATCLVRRNRWGTIATAAALIIATTALGLAWRQYQEARLRFSELRTLARVAIFDLDTAIQNLPGSLDARKKLLETALSYLTSLQAAAKNDPSLRGELADACQRVALLQDTATGPSLDRADAAIELLEEAILLRDSLGQQDSKDPKIRGLYGELLRRLTTLKRSRMRTLEADAHLAKLMPFSEQWIRDEPRSVPALELSILTHEEDTRRLFRQNKKIPALENERAILPKLALLREYVGESPHYWKLATDIHQTLAITAAACNLTDEALESFRVAIDASRKWNAAMHNVQSNRSLLILYSEAIYLALEIAPSKINQWQEYLDDFERILNSPTLPDPKGTYWNRHKSDLLSLRGHLAAAKGNAKEVDAYFSQAMEGLDRRKAQGQTDYTMALLKFRISSRWDRFRKTGR